MLVANKPGFLYIMANRRNGTIYVGCTSDLVGRVHQHREGLIEGFTKQHGCKLLVCTKQAQASRARDSASFKSRNGVARGSLS